MGDTLSSVIASYEYFATVYTITLLTRVQNAQYSPVREDILARIKGFIVIESHNLLIPKLVKNNFILANA